MPPPQKLRELAQTRERLRQRIAQHRLQCVKAAGGLAPPLELLDRGLAVWREISPLARIASVLLVLFLKQKLDPGSGALGSLRRWAIGMQSALRGDN